MSSNEDHLDQLIKDTYASRKAALNCLELLADKADAAEGIHESVANVALQTAQVHATLAVSLATEMAAFIGAEFGGTR